MSELVEKQQLLLRCLGRLLTELYAKGWAATPGDGLVRSATGHMPGSLHYIGLAQDLNLWVNGSWIREWSSEWEYLGRLWLGLDPRCAWGGDWDRDLERDPGDCDFNHFSIEYQGRM